MLGRLSLMFYNMNNLQKIWTSMSPFDYFLYGFFSNKFASKGSSMDHLIKNIFIVIGIDEIKISIDNFDK